MKIKMLASGSKGNCCLLIDKNTKILIDVGILEPQIKRILCEIDIDVAEIDGIFISHIHSDHIKGLLQLVKKYNLKVYCTPLLLYDLASIVPPENLNVVNDNFQLKDLQITFLATSHDVASYGFIIDNGVKSVVYITDTGYINRKYYSKTSNKDMYIIESNHDEEMVMKGPYPYYLKQRVISDKGHLSNRYTGQYLAKVIGNNTKKIVLAHISENNNTYDLALSQVKKELENSNFNLNSIVVARQAESTELIEV